MNDPNITPTPPGQKFPVPIQTPPPPSPIPAQPNDPHTQGWHHTDNALSRYQREHKP
jgi:hypothetical protein